VFAQKLEDVLAAALESNPVKGVSHGALEPLSASPGASALVG